MCECVCECVSLTQQLFTGGLVASGTLINTPFPAALFTYFCTCSEMKISKFIIIIIIIIKGNFVSSCTTVSVDHTVINKHDK